MSCEASFCSAPFCSSDNSWSEFQPCLVLLHLITNRKEWKYIYMLNRSLSRIHVYSINIYIYIQYDNRCRKSYHDHYIVQSIIIILIKTYIFSFDSTHRSSLITPPMTRILTSKRPAMLRVRRKQRPRNVRCQIRNEDFTNQHLL